MNQTFIGTSSFQVIVAVAVALCIVGIVVSVYNIIQYGRMDNDFKQVQTAQRLSIVIAIMFGLGLVVIITILAINLNKSSCVDMAYNVPIPEIATFKNLAEVFE